MKKKNLTGKMIWAFSVLFTGDGIDAAVTGGGVRGAASDPGAELKVGEGAAGNSGGEGKGTDRWDRELLLDWSLGGMDVTEPWIVVEF